MLTGVISDGVFNTTSVVVVHEYTDKTKVVDTAFGPPEFVICAVIVTVYTPATVG